MNGRECWNKIIELNIELSGIIILLREGRTGKNASRDFMQPNLTSEKNKQKTGGSAVPSGPRCAFSRSEERGRGGGGSGVDIT